MLPICLNLTSSKKKKTQPAKIGLFSLPCPHAKCVFLKLKLCHISVSYVIESACVYFFILIPNMVSWRWSSILEEILYFIESSLADWFTSYTSFFVPKWGGRCARPAELRIGWIGRSSLTSLFWALFAQPTDRKDGSVSYLHTDHQTDRLGSNQSRWMVFKLDWTWTLLFVYISLPMSSS